MTEHPTSHAAEGDSAFVDRLRAYGLVRGDAAAAKPVTLEARAPSAPAGDAGALARRLAAIPGATRGGPADAGAATPAATPYGTAVEITPPVAATRASGPIVRHFRVLEPKMQRRALGTVTRLPSPTA